MGEASNNILLIAKMRGDGILWKWRTLRDKLMDEKNEEAQQLTPFTIRIVNEGDKEALKLIKFVKATNILPLPSPESEEAQRKQVTFNILNMTAAGTGAIQIEFLKETLDLTSESVCVQTLEPFCCSGKEHCIIQKLPTPKYTLVRFAKKPSMLFVEF